MLFCAIFVGEHIEKTKCLTISNDSFLYSKKQARQLLQQLLVSGSDFTHLEEQGVHVLEWTGAFPLRVLEWTERALVAGEDMADLVPDC